MNADPTHSDSQAIYIIKQAITSRTELHTTIACYGISSPKCDYMWLRVINDDANDDANDDTNDDGDENDVDGGWWQIEEIEEIEEI